MYISIIRNSAPIQPSRGKRAVLIEPNLQGRRVNGVTHIDCSQLVGLGHVLHNGGYTVGILNAFAHGLSPQRVIREVSEFGADVIGISAYGTEESIEYLRGIVPNFRDRVVVLGGFGPTYSPALFADSFKPQFMVRGEGELALQFLAQMDFLRHKAVEQGNRAGMDLEEKEDTLIVKSIKSPNLDDIGIERPYGLEDGRGVGKVGFQRGCIGRCSFCVGEGQKDIRYKSPKRAVEEVLYLVREKKARHIQSFGPDFTARAREANAIIAAMNEAGIKDLVFNFSVRVDTAAAALRANPNVWKKFMRRNSVIFEPGYESSVPAKLVRLGKYPSLAAARQHISNLIYIMENFSCIVKMTCIQFDPQTTAMELLVDARILAVLIDKFLGRIIVAHAGVNTLVPVAGTQIEHVPETWLDDLVIKDEEVAAVVGYMVCKETLAQVAEIQALYEMPSLSEEDLIYYAALTRFFLDDLAQYIQEMMESKGINWQDEFFDSAPVIGILS